MTNVESEPLGKAAGPVTYTGGCLCGRLRFEASGLPVRVSHCHCFACRRHTGAAVATFAGFRRSHDFRWSKGKVAVYRSSATVRRSFCRRCGTPLTYEADGYEDEIYVLIGAFDEPDRLPADSHVHVAQKVSWFDTADDLPRYDGKIGSHAPSPLTATAP